MRIKTPYSPTTKAPCLRNGGGCFQRATILKVCNFSDSDARSIFSDCLEEELLGLEDKDEDDNDDEERTFCSRASNTEPHYLSIKHWHSAEWKTERKPSRELRVQSAPLKVKAIKAYYHDYSKK